MTKEGKPAVLETANLWRGIREEEVALKIGFQAYKHCPICLLVGTFPLQPLTIKKCPITTRGSKSLQRNLEGGIAAESRKAVSSTSLAEAGYV